MKVLHPHQIVASNFLLSNNKAFLLDDVGIGKTLEAIEAHRQLGGKAVVLCESNKTYDWSFEYSDLAPHITRYRVKGNKVERLKIYQSFSSSKDSAVLICNHHKLFPDIQEFLKIQADVITLDECDVINNATKIHSYMKWFFRTKNRLWFLSAYPFGKDLSQFYHLFDAMGLAQKLFGTYFDFCDKYCVIEVKRFSIRGHNIVKRVIVGAKNIEEFKRIVAPYCLRRTKQSAGVILPPVSFRAIGCQLSERQKHLYTLAKKNKLDTMSRKEMFEPIAKYAFITQILNSPHLIDPLEEEVSAKIDQLLFELKRIQKKTIVFTQFKKWFPVLSQRLREKGYNVFEYSGDISPKERHNIESKFKEAGDNAVFLGTGAMKKGINLQFCSNVYVLDFMFNPVQMLQLFGRVDRIGQENNVLINYIFMENTHEEKIFAKLKERQELVDNVMRSDNRAAFDLSKAFENILGYL